MRRPLSLAAAMILLFSCASAEAEPASAEQLDELVARVALYPDELLALVLPASTQPAQIVEADRFLEGRKRDPQIAPAESWDTPVKSLLNYPEVIRWMSRDLAWTQALGRAVESQQADVMEAIQQVRTRALAAGHLKTNERWIVSQADGFIRIRSADPKVIYVPIYDATLIYVASPTTVVTYYPPYPCYWCPSAAFGMGMMMGFSWYYHDIYYDYDDDIDIDIDIDRPDRPDRPVRPDHHDPSQRPANVWKPARPGAGQGALNQPAGPAALPAHPGVGGGAAGLDRLTKLPSTYEPSYQKPSTQGSYGGYQRGRDAMRESDRGAQSRGVSSRGAHSTRSSSSWGDYDRGNRADAWSSRGASSRASMPSGGRGGYSGGRGGGGGGGGRRR